MCADRWLLGPLALLVHLEDDHTGRMKDETRPLRFVVRTTLLHAMTYLVVGIIAALAIDYAALFREPIISDYMRPFGSVWVFIGPAVQLLRGLIIALVLLPFRDVLRRQHGWLWLWLLLIGIGILSTSAAAPSSIEGLVYTQLPLWYHAIGLPEMLIQTLAFSIFITLYERYPAGLLAALPPVFDRLLRAVVTASLAFVGYAVISVAFALLAGATLNAEQNLSIRVQGVFVIPFLANGAIAYLAARSARMTTRRAVISGVVSYAIGFAAILAYQAMVSGSTSPLYALIAPIIPAAIVAVMCREPWKRDGDNTATTAAR